MTAKQSRVDQAGIELDAKILVYKERRGRAKPQNEKGLDRTGTVEIAILTEKEIGLDESQIKGQEKRKKERLSKQPAKSPSVRGRQKQRETAVESW